MTSESRMGSTNARSWVWPHRFARDDVRHQLMGWSENAQRLPWQRSGAVGPGLFQAMFRGSDVIAIQDMHLVARNRLGQSTADLLDQGL